MKKTIYLVTIQILVAGSSCAHERDVSYLISSYTRGLSESIRDEFYTLPESQQLLLIDNFTREETQRYLDIYPRIPRFARDLKKWEVRLLDTQLTPREKTILIDTLRKTTHFIHGAQRTIETLRRAPQRRFEEGESGGKRLHIIDDLQHAISEIAEELDNVTLLAQDILVHAQGQD